MRYSTRNIVDNIAKTVFIISAVSVMYSIIAGIWLFNPLEIVNFNLKLLTTSIIIAIVAIIVGIIVDECD